MGLQNCKSLCLNVKQKDLEFIDVPDIKNIHCIKKDKKGTEDKEKEIFHSMIRSSKSNKNKDLQKDVLIDGNMLVGKANGNINENYKRSKKLGEGSYGTVYLVDHVFSGQKRAMKIIMKIISEDNQQSNDQEIVNEIEILKNIDHPNIIKIFEFYNSTKNYYLITEFCEEGELFEKIVNEGPFDEEFTAYIMYQIFSAVNYCHSRNILHRDLKPENILLERKEKYGLKIKIIDFGTAKLFEKNKSERKVIGSSYYIAPEVLSKSYNEKCDMWSCGVIMYILLSASPPFTGKGDNEILENIKRGFYDIETKIWQKISDEAKNLIKNLLEKNIGIRISAEEALNHNWFKNLNIKEKLNFVESEKIKKMLQRLTGYSPNKFLQHISLAYLVHNFPQHEEVLNANKLFNIIDTNSNGQINKYELKIAIKKLLKNDCDQMDVIIQNIFSNVDGDKNGYIEYEEFVRGCIDKEKFITDDVIKFSFNFFDKDKNGEITCEEIKEILLKNINKNIKSYEESVKKIIKQVDINNDGKVSFSEFKDMMKNLLQ
jgi:calcium-dependent protein kinase